MAGEAMTDLRAAWLAASTREKVIFCVLVACAVAGVILAVVGWSLDPLPVAVIAGGDALSDAARAVREERANRAFRERWSTE